MFLLTSTSTFFINVIIIFVNFHCFVRFFFFLIWRNKTYLFQSLIGCNWRNWHVQLWNNGFILNFLGVHFKWFPKHEFDLEFTFKRVITQLTFTCSKWTIENLEKGVKYVQSQQIKTPEWCNWRRSGVFIVNFEHVSRLFLVFLLLTLNK